MEKDFDYFITFGEKCSLKGDALLKFAGAKLKEHQDAVRTECTAARAEAANAREADERARVSIDKLIA